VISSLVLTAPDGHKQDSVGGIVAWFMAKNGIAIDPKKVHFFDDKKNNHNN